MNTNFLKYSLTVSILIITILVMFLIDNNRKDCCQSEFAYQSYENNDINQPNDIHNHNNYTLITGGKLPNKISFAGEKVDVKDIFVREALDREIQVNTYWHSSTLLNMKRSKRWFHVIEPILKRNGIPDDFKYLALIESGFQNVVSPRGAAGFWQLLKGTAKEHNLKVNKFVDERFHVEKATQAACEYLLESYRKYQNWTLTAASYNAGRRRISESLEKQYTNNYYDLYLNQETSRYIFRILAIKTIYENPKKYGFGISDDEYYPVIPYKKVKVSKTIKDLPKYAKDKGISYKQLKLLNPWIINTKLRVGRNESYQIKLPK